MMIRVEGRETGEWVELEATPRLTTGGMVEVSVPEMGGVWLVAREGMVANSTGWAIYTIHPEDCGALVDAVA